MLTPIDAQRIHDASLRILAEIGVRLEHDGIVARLRAAGAVAGTGAQEVRFPPEMVAEYLALAPRTVTLAARNGADTLLSPESASVYWTNPGLQMLDAGGAREATSADLAAVARLCDGLPAVQGVLGMAMADVPPPCRDFTGLRVIAEHTRKHVRVLCFTPTGMQALAEMGRVFPGPWYSIGFTAHGPLRWTRLALDIFQQSAGHGIPTTINGEPMAGVTGPVTLAGAVAVGNAEILAGVIVNQLLEPGRPVIYNLGLAHAFDMRHATAITGGPENALFAEASAAMGRFYGLPSSSWVSTEAVYEDEQAALEKSIGFHTHATAGVSLIWGMGQLESEKTMSLAQLVIDDEIIAYLERFRRGFAVNDTELAFDLIRDVGIAGSYLETDHTFEHFRAQLFEPRILNRAQREDCAGPLHAVAATRAAELLATDTEEKITPAESAELRRTEGHYRQVILG
jgi:trimethylamine--corrinoid protein Co-methyltransferase